MRALKSIFLTLGGLCTAAMLLATIPIVAVFFGAFSGWVVGVFFGGTILGLLEQMGIQDVYMWQVGAFLGFIGGFFRTNVSTNKDEE